MPPVREGLRQLQEAEGAPQDPQPGRQGGGGPRARRRERPALHVPGVWRHLSAGQLAVPAQKAARGRGQHASLVPRVREDVPGQVRAF